MLEFAGSRWPVPLCNFAIVVKAAIDDMEMNGYGKIPIKLYLQKQVDHQVWMVL